MKQMKLLGGLLFAALASTTNSSEAAITPDTVINFNTMTQSAYAGHSNITPQANGNCPGSGSSGCYNQFGAAAGIVQDTSNPIAHLHRFVVSPTDNMLQYHSDSSGIYIRAVDSSTFTLNSMDFHAAISAENPIYGNNPATDPNTGSPVPISSNPADAPALLGTNEYWDIFGFGSALNPNLGTTDGFGTAIAHQIVPNGFDGNLVLSTAFQNIGAFWIHYHGYPQTPTNGIQFGMEVDNIHLNSTTPVPIPAAVWLFGSALTGLASISRRKAGKSAT